MGRILTLLLLSLPLASSQDTFDKVEKIVAIGDVHGQFPGFVAQLRHAGLIDARNQWIGGKTHFVQTGDILDRGPESRKIMDLLMSLEDQAKKAGGHVHSLMGNHEAMNVYGDLRYIDPGEWAAFATKDSATMLDNYWKQSVERGAIPRGYPRAIWNQDHPPGWIEHRLAFQADGKYGKWIREKNAIVKVNDNIFLHGGISPRFAAATIKQINEEIRAALRDFSKLEGGMALVEEGPLWYRGLAEELDPESHVDQLLAHHKVSRIVLGHTPQSGGIGARYGGKVLLIDTGVAYGGSPEYLVIQNGKAQAVNSTRTRPLP
jgi:hypothetical protein